jgi:hypothetical protein
LSHTIAELHRQQIQRAVQSKFRANQSCFIFSDNSSN